MILYGDSEWNERDPLQRSRLGVGSFVTVKR